ncbi:MAG: hypothetical protein LBE34_16530 [Flavobacteriaceae bacterium]|jgi:hypothetical protein|nr:hypothetical protein [Flavobacteriaceae bacterium]
MGKKIREIICPKCGSTKTTKQEHDYYKCNSCDTLFFLDTADITITHLQEVRMNHSEVSKPVNKQLIVIVLVVCIAAIVSFVLLLSKDNSETKNEVVQKNTIQVSGLKNGSIETFRLKDKRTILINLVRHSKFIPNGAGAIATRGWIVIHELPSGKIIKQDPFDVDFSIKGEGNTASSSIHWYRNKEQTLFAIVNEYFIYRFDEQKLTMVDVTNTYFEGITALESGVVSIKLSEISPSLLRVATNNGQVYLYSKDLSFIQPEIRYSDFLGRRKLVDKIYNLQKMDSKEVREFDFTRVGDNTYPYRLVDYTIRKQEGSPVEVGIFLSTTKSIRTFSEEKNIVAYTDFTKDRTYFPDSKVLGWDNEGVIIAIKMSRLQNEPYTLQKLKYEDTSVLWSVKTDWTYINKVYKNVSDAFVLFTVNKDGLILLDKEGNIHHSINLDYTFET